LGGGAQLAELRYDAGVLGVCASLIAARSALVRVRVEDCVVHCLLIDAKEKPNPQCRTSSCGGKEADCPSDFFVGPAD
jgi:hypothetical protein